LDNLHKPLGSVYVNMGISRPDKKRLEKGIAPSLSGTHLRTRSTNLLVGLNLIGG